MAYSYNVYTGNGSTTQFTIGFPYIRREHIKVYVAYTDTAYTYVNSATVQLAAAPGAGVRVEVRRVTPATSLLVDFADGSTLVAADLDTSNLQHLYLEQELDDSLKQTVSIDPATGLPDAGGQRIVNVGTPVSGSDAATKTYVDNIVTTGVPDGDKGDIVVLGAGTSWTINANAVTGPKIGTGAVSADKIASGAFTDSISSTSITTIATPNSVKTAYSLAAAALPQSGGTVSGTLGVTGNVTLSSTGFLKLPVGTTAQQPTPAAGMIRFNTDTIQFEGYGTAWGTIGGGAKGAGTDQVFFENGQTVTTNYTLTTNKNAVTAGPVTVNSGVTVTIPSGSSWVVV
jgi:hypothetical protein